VTTDILSSIKGSKMTFIVTFTVPGIPVPKARPRFRRIGNFVSTYTAAKTKTYEDQVRDCARLAMGSSSPLETPVAVYLYLRVPVPASYSKKRLAACLSGIEKPVKKPDLTNVGKSLEDGMNGIVYQDDSQIVKLYMTKVFSTDPGVEIMVTECLE
jgi:Holliday junction resolvase RusA-like endonuclease